MRTDEALLRQYKRRRPKKLAQRKDPLALTQAPCCGRCRFWISPEDALDDPFGECGRVVCTENRVGDVEKGTLIPLHELQRYDARLTYILMRVRSWTPSCPLYQADQRIAESSRTRGDEPIALPPKQPKLIEEDEEVYVA